ncbi:MAG: carboxymuconolactone decarboxylase family protein [Candidimonas sp.]|jgi:4-carboxymuconolactone decarboxylase
MSKKPSVDGMTPLAKEGYEIRQKIFGADNVNAWHERVADDPFLMQYFDFTHEICFAKLWGRNTLDMRMRSILSLAINAANGAPSAIRRHVRSCVTQGLSKEEIGEVLLHVYVYAGAHSSFGAFTVAREVFEEMESEGIVIPEKAQWPSSSTDGAA